MEKRTTIQKRFFITTLILFIITMPLVGGSCYYFLKQNANREILKQADILISTMEATRSYVLKYTTPILEREVPGKFIVEGMVDSFVNSTIFEQIEKDHPNYIYRQAAKNPLNLANKADIFESRKITEFKAGTLTKEWRGFIEKPSGQFYAVMKPVRVRDESCLSCHGDPDLAPDEVTSNYGKANGYGWEVGDVAAVDAIYIPADVPMQKALGSLGLFSGLFLGFILVFAFAVDYYLAKFIIRPIRDMGTAANKVSQGDFKQTFEVKTNDEMKDLATAFERMRAVIVKFIKS